MDSHPHSNISACRLTTFHSPRFPTSSILFLSSFTFRCPMAFAAPSHATGLSIGSRSPPNTRIYPHLLGLWTFVWGGEMGLIARRLLSLPSGLHFWKMHLAWTHARDIPSIMALVEGCSSTVESLTVASGYPGGYPCRPVWHLHLHGWLTTAVDEPLPGLIDLSKATKLRDATFEFRRPQWVSDTLRTITPSNGNLQQISLGAPYVIFTLSFRSVDPATLPRVLGETTYREWLELDRLLVLLWETHSIRLKILYLGSFRVDRPSARKCMDSLFPEVTTRGIANLEECEFGS